jgi:hypothetical protein
MRVGVYPNVLRWYCLKLRYRWSTKYYSCCALSLFFWLAMDSLCVTSLNFLLCGLVWSRGSLSLTFSLVGSPPGYLVLSLISLMAFGPCFCIYFSSALSYFLCASIYLFFSSYSLSFLAFSCRSLSINFCNRSSYFSCSSESIFIFFLWSSASLANSFLPLSVSGDWFSITDWARCLAFSYRSWLANESFLSFRSKRPAWLLSTLPESHGLLSWSMSWLAVLIF